ncbi:uncharacterized protein LOC103503506 isoform X1 [Cucumis melo]|uniref:Uncharacterized protein LOC103503506 isoform X1 n=1 Tax=Cucumis melo TaxID=3656 RepID=A0A1S3CQ20_CUCME|nr:uncharacterized protein LOC103503506 isoform X1 [Cucumis melo]
MGKKRRIIVFPKSHGDDDSASPSTSASASASFVTSTRYEKPIHYILKIQSFSLLKEAVASSPCQRFESQKFYAGGSEWKLALYPNGDRRRDVSDHISLYLVRVENNILSTTSEVNVVFTFLVYDTLRGKYLTVQDEKMRQFSATKREWGIEKLLPLNTFSDASNGFLVDDCCVFGVDIFVMNCNVEKGEVFSLIKQPNNYKYTWKLDNFSKLLDCSFWECNSFRVENCWWKIRLFPSGDWQAKPGFFSMYLMLSNLIAHPKGAQVYVEYEMAVLSQLEAVPPVKETYTCWFKSGCIEIYKGCGASNFMSLSDLKERTKGYLVNDTLVVEVKINVISTIKKIV